MKPIEPIEANRGKRTGARSSDKQYFSAMFHGHPTGEDIREAQIALGYHPGGYGGPNGIAITQTEQGYRMVTWYCWASCD